MIFIAKPVLYIDRNPLRDFNCKLKILIFKILDDTLISSEFAEDIT